MHGPLNVEFVTDSVSYNIYIYIYDSMKYYQKQML